MVKKLELKVGDKTNLVQLEDFVRLYNIYQLNIEVELALSIFTDQGILFSREQKENQHIYDVAMLALSKYLNVTVESSYNTFYYPDGKIVKESKNSFMVFGICN